MAQDFMHDVLGCVRLRVSRRARHFIATWKPGYLQLTVPAGATEEDVRMALSRMQPQLLKSRPAGAPWYESGRKVVCDDVTLTFIESDNISRGCSRSIKLAENGSVNGTIEYASDVDWSVPENMRVLYQQSMEVLYRVALTRLPLTVEPVFDRLGVRPRSWKVSRGRRILGTCRSNGEINISCAVMMLPRHLREYIVCHEVAHLTHPNHSPAFHALVDQYTGGKEKSLQAELRAFDWPLPRL